jgi:uncharacterized membrane protein
MKKWYKNYLNKKPSFDKERWIGIFCLIFTISGVFGFLYEFIFYYFNGGMVKFYWRGGNFLPWINIYAIGAGLIYFLTFKLRKKPYLVFLISMISTGILEFFSGYFMDIIRGGNRCWDYNNEILNFGNIGGFVCLRSVLIFGFMALILIYALVPFCFYLAEKSNKKTFLIISVSIFSIIMIDEVYNLLISRIFNLPRAYGTYKKLGFNFVKFK